MSYEQKMQKSLTFIDFRALGIVFRCWICSGHPDHGLARIDVKGGFTMLIEMAELLMSLIDADKRVRIDDQLKTEGIKPPVLTIEQALGN